MKAAFFGIALAGMSLAPIIAHPAPISIFHTFSVDGVGVWQSESFLASSGQWRIGALDGPMASGSEVEAVLSNLTGLGIHSTCANSDVGGLVSFCGIGVSNVTLGGVVTDDFTDPGQTSAGWLQQAEGSSAADAEWSAVGGNPGGYIGVTNTAFDTVPVALSLLAPDRYLGNQGTSFATGFSFWIQWFADNPAAFASDGAFLLATGEVSRPIPEPSVLLISALSMLATVCAASRRRLP